MLVMMIYGRETQEDVSPKARGAGWFCRSLPKLKLIGAAARKRCARRTEDLLHTLGAALGFPCEALSTIISI
jgi:hypothetical protein